MDSCLPSTGRGAVATATCLFLRIFSWLLIPNFQAQFRLRTWALLPYRCRVIQFPISRVCPKRIYVLFRQSVGFIADRWRTRTICPQGEAVLIRHVHTIP